MDAERLTKFGETLRRLSLDELPELFNILKGEMSLIGPRPLLVKYIPLYKKSQHRRHNVRPGLTGLAQINGRNLAEWDKKLEMDIAYVDTISFWGNIKIILKTFKLVWKKEGIDSKNSVTMEEFTGELISRINRSSL